MMSNSNEETLSNLEQTTPSKIRLLDEAGPSSLTQNMTTPSSARTDTTHILNASSSDNLYTVIFNFALSKIFFTNSDDKFESYGRNFGRSQSLL